MTELATIYQIDDTIYQRFDQANTAFNLLSKEGGKGWRLQMRRARQALVREGKTDVQGPLAHPPETLFQHGYAAAFATIDDLTGLSPGYSWDQEPPPEEILQRRCADPERLTIEVRRVARHLGADLIGVARLDPRWIYSRAARRAGIGPEPLGKEIRILETQAPGQTSDALLLPTHLRCVIVIAVAMDREMIATAPGLLADAATSLGYSRAAMCTLSLANYVRAIGYQAIATLNDTGLSVPMAVDAGLGEVGRLGLLITPEYGPCVRLAKVITDMPLLVDQPTHLGIADYCETCGICADRCPAQAISHDEPTWSGHNQCNNDGTLKWYVDGLKCLRYWTVAGTSCGVCVASCPFTQRG